MLGRHFEHVLWSNEFYDAMKDVDFIFILQKPTNMIGHLGGGSKKLTLSSATCALQRRLFIFDKTILKML